VRLDISVDDPGLVQCRESLRDRDHEWDQLVGWNRPDGESMGERAAVAELHDEERLIAGVRVSRLDVVDRHDVGMADRRERARLTLKAFGENRIPGEIGGQDLDRHIPVEAEVVGAIARAHRAAADPVIDAVSVREDVPSRGHNTVRVGDLGSFSNCGALNRMSCSRQIRG